MVETRRLTEVTDEVVEAFNRLIPQLAPVAPPERRWLEETLHAPGVTIFLACDPEQGDRIVGTLTLVTFQTPVNKHAWIEDVVVDESARNQGVGAALTQAGLEAAARYGSTHVDLTSRPSRQAANHLYQHLGFEKRLTNLYRYTFEDSPSALKTET